MLIAAAAAQPVGAQPTARWLIVVDDLHVDFRNTGPLRALVKTIAADVIHDGDQLALYSTGPSGVSVAWTYDRSVIDSVVTKMAGNALRVVDILGMMEGPAPTDEVQYRATIALRRVNAIVQRLDAALERTIAVIYISNGYVDRSPSLTRAGGRPMPIFALDPRLLPGAVVDRTGVARVRWNAYWTATRHSLRALSTATGGFALEEGDELTPTLARISSLVRE